MIGFQFPSFTGSEASGSVLVTLVVTNQVTPAIPVVVQVDAQVDSIDDNPASAGKSYRSHGCKVRVSYMVQHAHGESEFKFSHV